jgi:hypothetical protein
MGVSLVRWVLALALAVHGIAHVVGFAVAWHLTSSPEVPYHTTVLNGRLDAGAGGMRVIGLLWLVAAVAFLVSAVLLIVRHPFALAVVSVVAVASLALCAIEWPFSRIGVYADVVLILILPLIGAVAWRADSQDVVASLHASSAGAAAGVDTGGAPLPAAVARYFARTLPPGSRAIKAVTLSQDAEFLVAGRWRPLRATQRFTIAPAGFVWDARITMFPLMSVFVRDAYVGGRGSMRADIMALYPIIRQRGRRELDAGALHRYLAEAVWFPTALTSSGGVRWNALNDYAATATLSDSHTAVTAEFRFNRDGDIAEVFVPDRFAETNGKYEPRPWRVRCSEYESHDGVRVPVRCEVEWELPSGPQPYWRGRVVEITYEWTLGRETLDGRNGAVGSDAHRRRTANDRWGS